MVAENREIDPVEDFVGESRRGKRLRIGVRVLGSLAAAWLLYLVFTGEHLFGLKTIAFVLFLFAGSLVEFRPRRSLRRRRMGIIDSKLTPDELAGLAREAIEILDRGEGRIESHLWKLRSRFSDLHHFIDDTDIRKKDGEYKRMQEKCLKKFLRLVESGKFDHAEKITFLSGCD